MSVLARVLLSILGVLLVLRVVTPFVFLAVWYGVQGS